MPRNLLFVFEGEKTEKQITDNLTKFFVNKDTIVQCAYCADVYQVYQEILKDEYLDVFQLLKERPKNTTNLSRFSRNDFAEIYMFFDYDGHATDADDAKIQALLDFFDEETNNGKLYISYPMIEALKHISPTIDFKELKVPAKANIRYKGIVASQCDSTLLNITQYKESHWKGIMRLHLSKMNYIVNSDFSLPKKYIPQSLVFSHQLAKYIKVDGTVAVLCSFPIFLCDYYGCDYILGYYN